MLYVVQRCIWYRQKTRGRSPTLGGRFPPKGKKSIDLETVVSSKLAKMLEVATKIRETCEKHCLLPLVN